VSFAHPVLVSTAIPRRQRGVVLLIALIMLVMLTLGGIALFRQMGAGVLVARNLTFRNAALVGSDRGVEAALIWLTTSGADLDTGSAANAYYPGWCNTGLSNTGVPVDPVSGANADDCGAVPPPTEFNPLTYNWTNSVTATPANPDPADANADVNGNRVQYVIHRLCRISGSINFTNVSGIPQECVTLGSFAAGGPKTATEYGGGALPNVMQPYYRITTRTTGPSGTVAYSQVITY
jgi:type IV pilus assembly protein PilX